MRPALRLLDDDLIGRILAEARQLLCHLGVEIHNPPLVELLADHGAKVGADGRVRFTENLADRALATAPRSFRLFDVLGNPTHKFAGDNVYFTPGSAAIHILDPATGRMRRPDTSD